MSIQIPAEATAPLSRRRALALLSVTAVAAAIPVSLRADEHGMLDVRTPEEALRELRAGNQRFVDGKSTEPNRTMARIRELSRSQSPFAAVLSCADSRVPVEILFDQGFGDLFVCRAAGNIREKKLAVTGGVYDLATGRVTMLDV